MILVMFIQIQGHDLSKLWQFIQYVGGTIYSSRLNSCDYITVLLLIIPFVEMHQSMLIAVRWARFQQVKILYDFRSV